MGKSASKYKIPPNAPITNVIIPTVIRVLAFTFPTLPKITHALDNANSSMDNDPAVLSVEATGNPASNHKIPPNAPTTTVITPTVTSALAFTFPAFPKTTQALDNASNKADNAPAVASVDSTGKPASKYKTPPNAPTTTVMIPTATNAVLFTFPTLPKITHAPDKTSSNADSAPAVARVEPIGSPASKYKIPPNAPTITVITPIAIKAFLLTFPALPKITHAPDNASNSTDNDPAVARVDATGKPESNHRIPPSAPTTKVKTRMGFIAFLSA